MEKSQTELLQEFREEVAALKERISALEEKICAMEALPAEEETEVDFTDIAIGMDEPEPVIPGPDRESPEMADQVGHDETVGHDDTSGHDDTIGLPWRKDKPGLQVKNIRSGISLLDRALFIGTLFKEDFVLYDQTIADLNAMSTLDEAVSYIREHFPSWNLKSDVVYHFMMSIRKKLG